MATESFESEVEVEIVTELVIDNIDLSGRIYDDFSLNKTKIGWGVELDFRNSGIKGFYFAAPDQTITLTGS